MRIFIDARLYGPEHTGIGRYTKNVLKDFSNFLAKQRFAGVILVHSKNKNISFGKNWQVITTSIRPYSFLEQLAIPYWVRRYQCDLFLGFHFNIPVFLTVPFIPVIHDLIKSYFIGEDNTTRSKWLYQLKRIGYEWSMWHAVTHSLSIIVPSNTVKNQILARYDQEPSKIYVIPEAPDDIFRHNLKIEKWNLKIPKKYLLFVGNAYPHKNLGVLLKAMERVKDKSVKLVIVAKYNSFLEKTLKHIDKSRLIILSNLSDQELVYLYKHAKALITPSLMEGYGLPGIEAQMVGTPVIASNIPVYREVYGKKVNYFDPQSPVDLARAIDSVLVSPRGRPAIFNRSWSDVAFDISEAIIESSSRLRSS